MNSQHTTNLLLLFIAAILITRSTEEVRTEQLAILKTLGAVVDLEAIQL